MLKHALALAAVAAALVGCGVTPAAAPGTASSDQIAARGLNFRPVTLKDLVTMPYDDPKSIGALVRFEASFGRERWSYVYGTTTDGYKLWDHEGHGIRCYNIFTESSYQGKDASRDLNLASQWLLDNGTYVTIEGAYHPGMRSSTHGADAYVEKSIDVYFINGKPVKDFVSK